MVWQEPLLNQMRRVAESLLSDTCHIIRPTKTPDGTGGVTTTTSTINTGVPCRMINGQRSLTNANVNRNESIINVEELRIAVKKDQDIRAGDIIEYGDETFYAVRLVDSLTDRFFKIAVLSRNRS